MKKKNDVILRKMIKYIDNLKKYAKECNGDFKQFRKNTTIIFASSFCIEQIGEIQKKLETEIKTRFKDVNWKDLQYTRNRHAHHYGDIDPEQIWSTMTEYMPDLQKKLKAIRKEIKEELE